ncbi:MAG: ComF family protein [Clostridia bacterium]|nr:ComF family protein [Clostridia bacterium]
MTSVLIDDNSGCEEIISALKYDGKIREAMLRFKFKNIKYLGYTFGKLLAEAVKDRSFMNEAALITYVPIHVSRNREYNQSAVIAEHICSELGLECSGGIIYRIKPIERLSSMNGYDKEFYIRNSYMFNPLINLSGKTVVIVDDVLTTGTTLRTVSEELRKHGAKHVYALIACYSKTQ